MKKDKIVLAYSGGLDTSIIIPWLKENYDAEIIATCIDVGQDEDMEKVKSKAIASGATKVYVEYSTDEFVKDYVYKAIKANALYEGKYLLGTSLARPLMAKKLVEIAHKEGAAYICHGCTGKGNDQVRFEVGIAAFDPSIKVIAPWRIWDIKSREDAIDYAQEKGIKVPCTKEKIYSRDQNLLHISHEGGDLEDTNNEHKDDILYMMTKTLEKASNTSEYVEIEFQKGEAVSVNGEKMKPHEILTSLNAIGSNHGIGVLDMIENRLVGMKSRGVYETPGGSILIEAHKLLETLTLDRNTVHTKSMMSIEYSKLVYDGLWFSPLKEALDAFFDKTQEFVSGVVKVKLYKGNIMPSSIDSPYALYDQGISSFGESDLYNQKDAEGFINLFSLPTKIQTMMKKKNEINSLENQVSANNWVVRISENIQY
ncbi:argininosuccinate synthase [Acetoanaerobium pronyense]|uniref:Argininosuccinate synthase n=1 Tax=Acetoanaerobium pronyense TaxID=1482736 RepID=A0ABS4KJM7_9FIRM|nr:argininosuccinate synthase [Acetoanaerobium pronyense]MBP2027331.1 argininosuccinate synthase [Acetoanaerobium pronyense]